MTVLREPILTKHCARLAALLLLSASALTACTADSPLPPLGLALADIESSSDELADASVDMAAADQWADESEMVAQGDGDGDEEDATDFALSDDASTSSVPLPTTGLTPATGPAAMPAPIQLAARPLMERGAPPTTLDAQAMALTPPGAVPLPAPKPLPRTIPRAAGQGTALALAEPPKPIRLDRRVSAVQLPPPAARPAPSFSRPDDALPGVNKDRLFEIQRTDGRSDNSDIDIDEGAEPVQVASLSGLARLAPNGLHTQHDDVDVGCLKPALVRVLHQVEQKFGRPVVVTSGFRSKERNQRARGAKRSLHMFCAAADIQVDDVSKWTLADYLRSMPGRGGVGTYCHTSSVHIDVGPERDWNWRCKRRRRR